jgi:aminoglycoside phosphotransferase (APT) family kinase protein
LTLYGVLDRPRTDQPHYGTHLGDVAYWSPYVAFVLSRHHLPASELETPFAGSFPVFLAGDVVVKLFGPAFDGTESHAAELAMHHLLAGHPEVPAPGLIAHGCLFDDEPRWPYLVTGRLRGVAIREAGLDHFESVSVAAQLGEAVGRLHQLPAPGPVAGRDVLRQMRAGAAERLRGFGMPGHLAEQAPGYLADALPATSLVHADITADHVFVDRAGLVGLIDWGDALIADRYYELVAVYFDAFRGRRPLLTGFLRGYGWDRADDFSRRALQGVLEFQFDAISRISEMVDLTKVNDLGQLAERLFG